LNFLYAQTNAIDGQTMNGNEMLQQSARDIADTRVPGTVGIHQDAEGRLRWIYEFSLFRNPTILAVVWKILASVTLGIFLLLLLLEMDGGDFAVALTRLAPVFGALLIGLLALSALAYALYALLVGGKYCVVFEMDEKGVKHTHMDRQFRKAQWLALLTVLSGATAGNPSAAGAGVLAGSRRSVYSEFRKVRAITSNRSRSVIKLRTSDLLHNQIYADGPDFDYVLDYIASRVPVQRTP
jgi:hypothetical protein